MKRFLLYLIVALISSSCNIDDEIVTTAPPKILLDSATGVYTVKQGEAILIAPDYESAEDAEYRWMSGDVLLGCESSLRVVGEQVGSTYITLSVTTPYGSDACEIRVDVVEREIATVSIAAPERMTLAVGGSFHFRASVKSVSLPTTIVWTLDGECVAEGVGYIFAPTVVGEYTLTVTATTADGEHSDSVQISVVEEADMAFVWRFESDRLHAVVGRRVVIKPIETSHAAGVTYYWQSSNQPEDFGREESFVYTPRTTGRHTIKATASMLRGDESIVTSVVFTVDVYEEGAFRREKSATSSADWTKVFDYTPAPGQFINELKTGGFNGEQTTAAAAVAYAEARMSEDKWVSLGGFGGYIVVGFDHSIDAVEGFDFAVKGNAFAESNEPGIVWVMQDENGDGLPNDTWYELRGSESGVATTIRDYAVTYYRPSGAAMPVAWSDNRGGSGEIDYLAQYHTQDFYYPLWIAEESYTLRGTLLEARNYDRSGNGSMWIQPPYDWGYADNRGTSDGLEASPQVTLFDVANAMDDAGDAVALKFIDFVKVQCAVNAKSGWLGELSTEVCDIFDASLK